MDDANDPQPAAAHDCRIRFGKRPSATVPAEWAELMLTDLAAKNPKTFGRLLMLAATEGTGAP